MAAPSLQTPTIFNNVMGPIGMGPSTSNTCGPCRIAYLSRMLMGQAPKRVVIHFPEDSGYATPNCQGMRSDYAFAHGLLGRLPDSDEPLLDAFDDLKQAGISLEFVIDKGHRTGEHLLSTLELFSAEGDRLEVSGISKGGGIVELIQINGFDLSFGGETNAVFVFTSVQDDQALHTLAEELCASCSALSDYPYEIFTKEEAGLLLFPTYQPISQDVLESISQHPAVHKVSALPSLFPVVPLPRFELPFTDADSLTALCRDKGLSLTEAAIEYETAVSGWSREKVITFAQRVLNAMQASIENGSKPGVSFDGIVSPAAASLIGRYPDTKLIPDGIVTRAALNSLAIMEHSNATGVVVCMPTAGASGTVASALLTAGQQMGCSQDQLVEALLAAGAVGVSITADNDFCGGVYGCQAEVGCASCMAAAGLATLMGAGAQQALNAASMALQNMLGLICDPVCGLVQVPCFARNMSGIANAIVCANMCLLGFDPTIGLQGAFEAMKSSGSQMPTKLKGCGGGLCETARGLELLYQYEHRSK